MKKALIMLLCLLAALCLAVPALGEGVSRTVSVSGSSNISLAADTATLRIGVSTVRDTVAEAQSGNNEIMQRVIAAILGQNVAQEDVVTSDFSVYTERDYSDASVPVRYHVDNTLYVTVRALDTVGDIIDAATAAGANQMYGLTFSSSGETAAYEKALRRAYEDAAAKAALLAEAAGQTLGEVVSINASNSYGGDYGIANTYALDARSAKTAIVSGDVTVSASVTVVFAIK